MILGWFLTFFSCKKYFSGERSDNFGSNFSILPKKPDEYLPNSALATGPYLLIRFFGRIENNKNASWIIWPLISWEPKLMKFFYKIALSRTQLFIN